MEEAKWSPFEHVFHTYKSKENELKNYFNIYEKSDEGVTKLMYRKQELLWVLLDRKYDKRAHLQ